MFLKIMFDALLYSIKILIFDLIYIYKFLISPLFPKTCRFYPTCSTYMILCIKEFGIWKGIGLGLRRICKCTPHGEHGYDFVPLNIKGELKWTY